MIRLENIAKAYEGRSVLDGISLTIEAKSFVALVGQSGAGKTTLLKTINRLVDPDAGSITVDGRPIAGMSQAELRHGIGYVFQGIGLFPHMSVAENIWLSPRLQGQSPNARAQRVSELLELVSLPEELGARYPEQLSGGQAQRVGFARALAGGPTIMLMDEPFGALDPMTRSELGQAYRRLHERLGLTSIIVTHDLAEAMLLADRVLVLDQGRILGDMRPEELMRQDGEDAISDMVRTVRTQADRLEALARADMR